MTANTSTHPHADLVADLILSGADFVVQGAEVWVWDRVGERWERLR